jgi:hypothetical protein
MLNKTRLVIVAASLVMGLMALWLALIAADTPVAGALPVLTATPTPTVSPVFSATLSLEPDRDHLYVGQMITVTADITVSEGCIYPVFELTVKQDESEAPIFEHVDPPGDMITGPIQIPSAWTFRATQPGTGTFDARTFGEQNCGNAWIFTYLFGYSEPVVVEYGPYRHWIPSVMKPDNGQEE